MTMSTCTICHEPIHFEMGSCTCEREGCDPGWVWIHEHGDEHCGAGDGAFALPQTETVIVTTAAQLTELPNGTLVQVRGRRGEMWWYQRRGSRWEGGCAQPLASMVGNFDKFVFEAWVPQAGTPAA